MTTIPRWLPWCTLLLLTHGLRGQNLPDAVPPVAPAPTAPGAVLTGRITDAGSGQGIGDAVVLLEGTRLGTLTRQDGSFRLARVPAGSYTLRARRIGYQPMTRLITVAADTSLTVDLALAAAPTRLQEMVVTGTVNAQEVRSTPVAST
ncbi:MAG TPA: carboxypeptidase-like regulatory domain-containing protein, partial [Gemmatimonadales bacterium]|nr:carboxypeptidase-like regulatory domain-containing protein [Gemmatimonadales bacterium]